MGRIPDTARAQILSNSKCAPLQTDLEDARRRADDLWAEHERTGDKSLLAPAQRAQREYEVKAQRVEEEVDYWYRVRIVDGCFWSQDDPETDDYLHVFGPFGASYFTLEGEGGWMLAGYLGYDPAADVQGTSAWIGDVLWEHRRRTLIERAELEEKYRPRDKFGSTWVAPKIDFKDRDFITHLVLVDSAPGCPRCGQALAPSAVEGHRAYCMRCAQGYAMLRLRDGSVGIRPLHYDCPGCGSLRGVEELGAELGGTCSICGVVAKVSRGGAATYADRKAERKDAGTALFADKKRVAQLQRWRSTSPRVIQPHDSLAEAYAEWEFHLSFAMDCLPVEDNIAWTNHSRELLALQRFEFAPPNEETLYEARADAHRRRVAQLEDKLRAEYPFGPPTFEVTEDLKRQYPWAHPLIERLHRPWA
ncbi:hypothetical protein ABY45_16345 [Microbacterium maritypicum]|uniref:hypothetical protein n=1 Tax=Microbacterium maritypicum TaxID=33918 RepID=UPI003D6F5BDB